MNFYLILLFACWILQSALAYKIPDVILELLSTGFRVLIPDESGVSSVFYGIEINHMCPAHLEYVTEAKKGFWTTEQFTNLKAGDKLTIYTMVQYSHDVLRNTEYKEIGSNGEIINLASDEVELNDLCIDNSGIDNNNIDPISFDDIEKQSDNKECKISETTIKKVKNLCKVQQIFEETFNDSMGLNQSRWSYDIRLRMDSAVAEFVVFDNNEHNNFIKDGVLHIVPTVVTGNIRSGSLSLEPRCTATINPKRDCSVETVGHFTVLPPVYSTQIHTMKTFSFMYGRVDIRAKLPKGDWILPYIMLQPSSMLIDAEQPPQIRIAFARGNNHYLNSDNIEIGGSRLYSGIYYWEGDRRKSILRNIKHGEHFGDDFHTYSIIWTKTGIRVAVDGETFGVINEHLERFQEECFLVLGVSAGGHFEFADNGNSGTNSAAKPWINTSPKSTADFWKAKDVWKRTWNGDEGLKIDYVKVHAL